MACKASFTFVLSLILTTANGANILFLNAVSSHSHHFWNSAITNGLAAQGHNITVLSPDVDKNPPPNVRYILLEGLYMEDEDVENMMAFGEHLNPLTAPFEFTNSWIEKYKVILKTQGFKTLLAYPDDFKFDVIVHDLTAGPRLLGFVHKFNNPPLVSVTAYLNPTYLPALIGGHNYYAYVPHTILAYDGYMNLLQRLYNFAVYTIEYINWREFMTKKFDSLTGTVFGPNTPPLNEIEQRSLITLVNTNPAFDYPAPLAENVIPVGGLHILDSKPLPKDLEESIVSSKKGAILFTLGSNIKISSISIEKLKIFIDAFAKFPEYIFIWKFETASIGLELPKNVIIRKWLPQSDILAHPNVKALITHSGLLSTHEAIWRGKPILGIPFGFDQIQNIKKSKRLGFAEDIDFLTMTTESFTRKLRQILEDPKYADNAKKISIRFRDQKELPLDRAIWWIEWAMRNPDSDHLKSPVLKLGFIVGNSFDVIAIISFILFIFVIVIIKICLLAVKKYSLKSSIKKDKREKSQ